MSKGITPQAFHAESVQHSSILAGCGFLEEPDHRLGHQKIEAA
jgi:hypothetical protein